MQTMTKRTLEIKILSEEEAVQTSTARFLSAWNSGKYVGEYLTFTSSSIFFKIFNAYRWDLVVKLQSIGKTDIQELARQVGRDVQQVRDDINILSKYGIIEQDSNYISVPYDEIHTDFTLKAEAV